MKEKIIQLYKEGKSYREIEKILGCSKGTISYHCGIGQKEKLKNRVKNYKKTINGILKRKKDNFSFARGNRQCKKRRISLKFSSKEFKEKIINNPKCYLTGREIDLYQPKTYQCDHIIPISRGGNCSIENMGLTCREANMAKGDMILSEFLDLCKDVLINNGFKINKDI